MDKIKENGFELTKKICRRYPAKAFTDAVYADDIAILANTPNQAETLLHGMEQAAAGIGLHNAHKTESMSFNQTSDISTLDGRSLKLVDKLGSSVSSTEKDIDTRLTKAWKLSISYWSYGSQTWPIKWTQLLPSSGRIYIAIWMHYLDANKTAGEKASRQLHKIVASNIEQILNTPQSTNDTATYLPSRKLSKLDEPDMLDIAGEVGTSS